jgi:hypothetical protein
MREVNGVLTPFARRRVSAYLSHGPTLGSYHVSLVPSFGTSRLRFPKRSLLYIPTPEVPRSRTPRHSLSQLATLGFSGQKSRLLILRCAEMPNFDTFPSAGPQRNFLPFQNFDFAISRVLMLNFRFFNPRNLEMVNKGLTFVSTSTPPVHSPLSTIFKSFRPFGTSHFASLVARLSVLQLTKL